MTDIAEPEWLKNHVPATRPGRSDWKKGMRSPNPNGRPPGIVDKRTRVTQALMDDAPAITRVVIDAALAGDIQAATLVLSRVTPVLKAQAERVQFNLDANASATDQAASVLAAIASGDVSPDVGKQIIEAVAALYGIKQIDEIARRLEALEARRQT